MTGAGQKDRVQQHVQRKMSTRIRVPLTGIAVELPVSPDSLAFDAAIAALAVIEVIEWPLVPLLIAGHWLSRKRGGNRIEKAIGDALGEAP